MVEVSRLDAVRQALHSVSPDHPVLKDNPPSFGVWEHLRHQVEATQLALETAKPWSAPAILAVLNKVFPLPVVMPLGFIGRHSLTLNEEGRLVAGVWCNGRIWAFTQVDDDDDWTSEDTWTKLKSEIPR